MHTASGNRTSAAAVRTIGATGATNSVSGLYGFSDEPFNYLPIKGVQGG